jgi:hypothetical protein
LAGSGGCCFGQIANYRGCLLGLGVPLKQQLQAAAASVTVNTRVKNATHKLEKHQFDVSYTTHVACDIHLAASFEPSFCCGI